MKENPFGKIGPVILYFMLTNQAGVTRDTEVLYKLSARILFKM